MSLNPVDIKTIMWWNIDDSSIKSKYRTIERSFAKKFAKCVYNLIYFTSISECTDIQFIGESTRRRYYENAPRSIFYEKPYDDDDDSFWPIIRELNELSIAVNDLVVEKYIHKLIDLVKETLSEIKKLLGNTNEEIETHYSYEGYEYD